MYVNVTKPAIPWKITSIGLPSPILVPGVIPAILLAGDLVEDEGAVEAGVERLGGVVVHPTPHGPVALLARAPYSLAHELVRPLHLRLAAAGRGHLHLLVPVLHRQLHLRLVAAVEQQGDGADDDEEGDEGAHHAPQADDRGRRGRRRRLRVSLSGYDILKSSNGKAVYRERSLLD